MDIQTISEILEEFARSFTIGEVDREFFSDFIIYNDLGLPLAQAIVYNLAKPTGDGENLILETWNNFCELLEIDPNGDYEDLDDVFEEHEEE